MRKEIKCPNCGMTLQLLGVEESYDETTQTAYPRYYFYCPNCETEILMAEYSPEAAEEYAEYLKNPVIANV